MKAIILKSIGLFMTVFAVFGFGQAEQAHATTPETSAANSSFTTDVHSGGCCCASCTRPEERSIQDSDV